MKNLTEFEQALLEVCKKWFGEKPGYEEYIIKNSILLLELAKEEFTHKHKKDWQKSNWSAQDEICLKFIINELQSSKEQQQPFNHPLYDVMINWIQRLKKRTDSEQDWNENDENIIRNIKEAVTYYWHGDTQEIILNWLNTININSKDIKEALQMEYEKGRADVFSEYMLEPKTLTSVEISEP